ncbi:hypothetical protein [Microcoleus sp.]|uniref:hypothetical protein n=1 Tax=Microcoleus sp. TaxID=44472 RepID=UPI0035250F25
MIQTNVPNSEEILISALFGLTLPGLLLAYRLNFFKTINDKYKIIIPSFSVLVFPFLFPLLLIHPLPGSLSSVIPVSTFIIGQLLAEANNKQMSSDREKAAIHELYRKLLSNFTIAYKNKSHIKDFKKHRYYPTLLDQLKKMEDIKAELIKLETFQGLIPLERQLANPKIIIFAGSCEDLIDNFNTKLNQITRDAKRDAKQEYEFSMANRDIVERLSENTDDFLDDWNEFSKAVYDIKNFFV